MSSLVQMQQDVWRRRSLHTTSTDVIAMYRNPCRFQVEFSDYMNERARKGGSRLAVCEVGCEFGVTSLLLSPSLYWRHCLDLNADALHVLRSAARELDQEIVVHRQDMFRTAIRDESFDTVFSNGVLEHYSLDERVAALQECARITRPGGTVIVGVPNHLSLPYRAAYLVRQVTGRWHFPPEERIVDFSRELAQTPPLSMSRLLFFDKETIYAILPMSKYSSLPFRLLDRLMQFQPYLRVIELARGSAR